MMQEIPQYDFSNIDSFKSYLYGLIDKRTETQIFQGFTFDSKLFSMSLSAQINWSNLFFIPDALFPLSIMTKDEENYTLALSNRASFYGAALTHKNTALQTGNTLKQQVKDSTTISELETILNTL